MLVLPILAACNPNPPSVIDYDDLPPEGDAARGEQIFNEQINAQPACSSCHADNNNASPDLTGFGERAEDRVAEQESREYAFYSIVEPGRYIVDDFGNAMPNQYDDKLTPQDIADLIAYLLSL
jgi:mono/diheme cytochrome c family protein